MRCCGMAEAVADGADVVFLADDDSFVALDLVRRRVGGQRPGHRIRFVHALHRAAGDIAAREILVMGPGCRSNMVSMLQERGPGCFWPRRTRCGGSVRHQARGPSGRPRAGGTGAHASPPRSREDGCARGRSSAPLACPSGMIRKPCRKRPSSTIPCPQGWR
jgi:hypothetical protein